MSIMGDTVFLQTLIKLDSQNLSAGSCVKILRIQIITFYYSFKYHSMRMIVEKSIFVVSEFSNQSLDLEPHTP